MGFFRQEYWSGLPFLSPGDLPNPGIETGSPALQTDSLPSEPHHDLTTLYVNYTSNLKMKKSKKFFKKDTVRLKKKENEKRRK